MEKQYKTLALLFSLLFFISVLDFYCAYKPSISDLPVIEPHSQLAAGEGAVSGTDLASYVGAQIDSRLISSSPSTGLSIFANWNNNGCDSRCYDSQVMTRSVSPGARNLSSWTRNGAALDFTGVSGWNSMGGFFFGGGTLISPRHFVFAGHYPLTSDTEITFFDSNGNPEVKHIVNTMSVYGDLSLGVLDSDVSSAISHYPAISSAGLSDYLQKFYNQSTALPIVVFVTHDASSNVQTQAIVRSLDLQAVQYYHSRYTNGTRSGFSHDLIGGDSGQPAFLVIGSQPILLFTSFGSADGGPAIGDHVGEINAAMNALGNPNNYTVNVYDLSSSGINFTKYSLVPPTPTAFKATLPSSCISDPSTYAVTLNWNPPTSFSSSVDHYNITIKVNNYPINNYQPISVQGSQLTYSHLSPNPSTNYTYSLQAVYGNGLFVYSGNINTDVWTPALCPVPVVITEVVSSNITPFGAMIGWKTDKPASSQIEFGQSTTYGRTSSLDSTLLTSHFVSLSGLTACTTYHYRARSKDSSSNETIGLDNSFKTICGTNSADTSSDQNANPNASPSPASVPPPVISAITSSSILTSGATIRWNTDKSANSQVEYGLTASYGQSSILDNSMLVSHSVTLSGLSANTVYHYRVKSKDSSGNLTVSADNIFTTTKVALLGDTTAPSSPNNLHATVVSQSQVNISWAAASDNVAVTAYKVYRNSVLIGALAGTAFSDNYISPSTNYSYSVSALDAASNESARAAPISVTTRAGNIPPQLLPPPVIPKTPVVPVVISDISKQPVVGTFIQSKPIQNQTTYKDINLNDKGQRTLFIQKALNALGYEVAQSGPGSPGNETNNFDEATKEALIRYQSDRAGTGLIPTGTPDNATLFLLKSGLSDLSSKSTQNTVTPTPGSVINRMEHVRNFIGGFIQGTIDFVSSIGNNIMRLLKLR